MFVRTNKRWGAKKSACVLDRLRLFTTVKEKDIFLLYPNKQDVYVYSRWFVMRWSQVCLDNFEKVFLKEDMQNVDI